MPDDKIMDEVHFTQGYRYEALKVVISGVKKRGRSAELVICRDIPGQHAGGEGCFCDPRIIEIYPEDLE